MKQSSKITKSLTGAILLTSLGAAASAQDHAALSTTSKAPVSELFAIQTKGSAYESYFHLSKQAVQKYINGLHEEVLPESGLYAIDAFDGAPARIIEVKAGETVLADASGRAVIRESDGLPLILATSRSGKNSSAASADMAGGAAPQDQTPPPSTGGVSGLAIIEAAGIVYEGTKGDNTTPGGTSPNTVPEPAPLLVLGVGAAGFLGRRRKNSKS